MKGLVLCGATSPRNSATLLLDGCNYLRDVLASDSPDALPLHEAAADVLRECERALESARLR
jgi:hypothetical protein